MVIVLRLDARRSSRRLSIRIRFVRPHRGVACLLMDSACQAASPGRSRLSLTEWCQGVMMKACEAEELTLSLPFSVTGTGKWHSPHCGPVRRPCSVARSRLAGVGGAYGGMGSRRGRHALLRVIFLESKARSAGYGRSLFGSAIGRPPRVCLLSRLLGRRPYDIGAAIRPGL